MAVTVSDVISRARNILNDSTETRWSNDELLLWLNESYAVLVNAKPSECSVNAELTLAAGPKQALPSAGVRLLELIRNTHPDSNLRGITVTSKEELSAARPGWYGEDQELSIEHFVFDEMDPTHFYVYPPAVDGAKVEALYIQTPDPHPSVYDSAETEALNAPESLAPALVDYVLFRAFSKDADHAANANRAALHAQAFSTAVGTGFKLDLATSPNTGGKP